MLEETTNVNVSHRVVIDLGSSLLSRLASIKLSKRQGDSLSFFLFSASSYLLLRGAASLIDSLVAFRRLRRADDGRGS